jgi:hypothetical protein
MPEHCPECNAAMRSEPVQWRGLVRPVTAGDRRNRRDPKKKPMSAARAASVEYPGEVKLHYHCDACGVCVAPGETHVRSFIDPTKWVEMSSKRSRVPKRRVSQESLHKKARQYREKRRDPEAGDALRAYHRELYQRNLELRRKQRRERNARYREFKSSNPVQAEVLRVSHNSKREKLRSPDGEVSG